MKKLLWLLCIPVLAALLWPLFPVLTVTSNETGETLWQQSVSEGDLFTIRYTHSVARTDVDEVIRIGNGELIIDSTVYESFGAGLPADIHGEETIKLEDGKVIINNIDIPQQNINVYIGQVVANHRLVIGKDVLPLKHLSPPGTSVRFSVLKESILMRIGRGLFIGE